jgi:hypothetical protein
MSEFWWIAINGPTCAMSFMPLRYPTVVPTPEQMLGFPTREEAQHAQHVCLTAPMDEVKRFLTSLAPDVKVGRIKVIQPEHPQLPVGRGEQTVWLQANPERDPNLH